MAGAPGFDLADGVELLGVPVDQLWWRYVALGGALEPAAFAALVTASAPDTTIEADLAAQAVNEAFLDKGLDSFPVRHRRLAAVQVAPRTHRLRTVRAQHLAVRREAAMSRARQLQNESARLIRHAVRIRVRQVTSARAAVATAPSAGGAPPSRRNLSREITLIPPR